MQAIGTAPRDLKFISQMVYEHSGIVLDDQKDYLIQTRMKAILRDACLASLSELVSQLRSKRHGELHEQVIEAMTTNETSFFRDLQPFEALRKEVLPDLIKRRANSKELNLWCAAASSGQEPFSIAMLVREHFPELADWKLNFIGTDISIEMLDRCRAASYSQLEVNRGLPAVMMVKYFKRDGARWRVKPELRDVFTFKQFNLAGQWLPMPIFDIVFIRNVLIYFDLDTKKQILTKVRQHMAKDGCLFLGGAETTINLDQSFERLPFKRSGAYHLGD